MQENALNITKEQNDFSICFKVLPSFSKPTYLFKAESKIQQNKIYCRIENDLSVKLIHNKNGKLLKELTILKEIIINKPMILSINFDGNMTIKLGKNEECIINSMKFPITEDSVIMKPTRDTSAVGLSINSFERK